MAKKFKYHFIDVDHVYTPFIGGYWTKTIRAFILLNLSIYCLQILLLLLTDQNLPVDYFALRPGPHFAFWQLASCALIHSPVPAEIFFTVVVLTFAAGDLHRCWGTIGFFSFYFFANIAASSVNLLLTNDLIHYGSMAPSIALLWALSFRHPKRLIYGKVAIWQMTLLTTFIVSAMLVLLYILDIAGLDEALTIPGHLTMIIVAFIAVRIWPIFIGKFLLWKLFNEINVSYQKEIFKEELDVILDKVFLHGMSGLTDKEQKSLQRASRIFKEKDKENHES